MEFLTKDWPSERPSELNYHTRITLLTTFVVIIGQTSNSKCDMLTSLQFIFDRRVCRISLNRYWFYVASIVQYIYPIWDMNEYILFHEIKQAKNMPTFLCCYLAMYWRKLIFDCFISFHEVLTERI